MFLNFRLITTSDGVYRYAYSSENNKQDGIVLYDTKAQKATVEKPCSWDDQWDGIRRDKCLRIVTRAVEGTLVKLKFPDRKIIATG